MPEDAKHPLILCKGQHVSTLIIKHIDCKIGHGGRAHTLPMVRKRFWITKANSAVRMVIAECSFCRRYNGRATKDGIPSKRENPSRSTTIHQHRGGLFWTN